MFARLGTKLAVAHGLLVAVFAVGGAATFLVTAERALDEEMSSRSRAAARMSAASFDASLLPALSEGSVAARALSDERLSALANAAGADRIVVLDADGRILSTSDRQLPHGAEHPGLALYGSEARRARESGAAQVSEPYAIDGGAWFQSAWVPLAGSAVLGAELRVAWRAPIARLRRAVAAFALCGVAATALIGVLLARRVTRPLARLARAMEEIGPNGLPKRAGVRGSDEVGRLGERFDALVVALERHDAELRALSATVAHEVRNPLGAMSGYAELVERRYPDSETKKLVGGIREEIESLERLVSRFLSFAGDMRISRRPIAVGGLLEDALRAAIPPGSPVQVDRRFAAEGPLVDADGDALREVFVNLVRNALQATGGRGRLGIAAAESSGRVDVSVSDDGPGIPEEILPRLFQPFATTKADGTGLGLAICRRIIAGHDGTLHFETGKTGTTFRVSLPSSRTN